MLQTGFKTCFTSTEQVLFLSDIKTKGKKKVNCYIISVKKIEKRTASVYCNKMHSEIRVLPLPGGCLSVLRTVHNSQDA